MSLYTWTMGLNPQLSAIATLAVFRKTARCLRKHHAGLSAITGLSCIICSKNCNLCSFDILSIRRVRIVTVFSSGRAGISYLVWSHVIHTARNLHPRVGCRRWRRYHDNEGHSSDDRRGIDPVGLLRGRRRGRRVAVGRYHLLLWRQALGGRCRRR